MPRPTHIPEQEETSLRKGPAEVREILGAPPGWALRWGITAVFIAVLLLLLSAWFIRYPDSVQAEVALVSAAPPVRLIAQQSGKLQGLFVADGQQVDTGHLLAVLENPAQLEDVQGLIDWLATDSLAAPDQDWAVGELQPLLAQWQRQWADYAFWAARTDFEQRLAALAQQQQYREGLAAVLEQQRRVLQSEQALAQANYERNQRLAATGNVSQIDLELAEAAALRAQRQLEAAKADALRNQMEAAEVQSTRIALQQERLNGLQQGRLQVQEARSALQAAAADWAQRFLVVAPLAGRVAMHERLQTGQYLQEGQLLLSVVPSSEPGSVTAQGYLPVRNSGLVRPGQRVQLFLEAYPQQQFGALRGELKQLSLLPQQSRYFIEIALPEGLRTTYGQELPFTPEQPATAYIITEDRRLLQRLTDRLFSLWLNR